MAVSERVRNLFRVIDARIGLAVPAGVTAPRRGVIREVIPSSRTLMVELEGGTTRVPVRGYPAMPLRVAAGMEATFDVGPGGWFALDKLLGVDAPLGLQMVNVRDYGAVGDGVHDDTGPIQNAIADAIARGIRIVYFPLGIYLITSTIAINTSDVQIWAGGPGITRTWSGSRRPTC